MILLDTHVWVWWLGDARRLSKAARAAIAGALDGDRLYVSSISAWEVGLLVARGRLKLTMEVGDWIAKAESLPFLAFVPVDNQIALESTRLPPPLHADPADRMIVATALRLGATLVTSDGKLARYPHVRTVW